MDRLHPPRPPPVGASASSSRTAPARNLLTSGPGDEGPSWAASSRELIFQRTDATGGTASIGCRSTAASRAPWSIPQGGSDPDWSGVMD